MYMVVLAAAAALLAAVVFMTAPRMSGRRRVRPFFGVKWAHRGLHDISAGIPENSLPAFRAAADAGYGIELDVHLTKDRRLVVFHDDTFERMCGEKGLVRETGYEQIKKYRLCGTDERIPLFSEVLNAVDGRVPILIEVKLFSADTEICRYLVEELEQYRGKYMIQSFNCLVLRWLKKYKSEIPRGQLSGNLTAREKEPHYLLRFCVKYLLTNFLGRPDFISYKWTDRKNAGLWLNRAVYRTPTAAWTMHGEKSLREAEKTFDMQIFEMQ